MLFFRFLSRFRSQSCFGVGVGFGGFGFGGFGFGGCGFGGCGFGGFGGCGFGGFGGCGFGGFGGFFAFASACRLRLRPASSVGGASRATRAVHSLDSTSPSLCRPSSGILTTSSLSDKSTNSDS